MVKEVWVVEASWGDYEEARTSVVGVFTEEALAVAAQERALEMDAKMSEKFDTWVAENPNPSERPADYTSPAPYNYEWGDYQAWKARAEEYIAELEKEREFKKCGDIFYQKDFPDYNTFPMPLRES